MSRTGAALLRSGIIRSVSIGVSMATMLALVPLMVEQLGDRLYGAWLLVGTILGAYGLLDLGLSSAVNRFVASALGRGDHDDADRYITTAVYIFSVAGILCIAAAIIAALLVKSFVAASEADLLLFRNVILVTGISFALAFPSRGFVGVAEAYLRHDLVSLLEIGISLLRLMLFVAVLYGGGKLMALAIASSVLLLVRAAATIRIAHRLHGRTQLRRDFLSWTRIRSLFGYSLITSLAQVADLLRTQIFTIIIPKFLSLAAVTPYGIAAQVVGAITSFAGAVISTTGPVFSRQEARDDQAAVRWTYFFNYKLACFLAVFLVGLIAVLGRSFIVRWVGGERESAVSICHILLLAALFGIMQIPTIHYMYGTSRHRYFAAANLVEGVVNVILSLLLVRSYGSTGIAVGTVIAVFLSKIVILPLTAGWSLQIGLFRYHFVHTLPNLARPGLFIALLYLVTQPLLAPNYLTLTVVGCIATLLFGPYIFFAGFSKPERALLLASIRQIRDERAL